jgi:phage shock protein PspC (stress-responsive transcriptional regulator)
MTQTPDATTTAPPRNTLDDLFGRLRSSGFHRDTDRRWFGGVCAGLAGRFGVDPLLIRAAAIVLVFAGGVGITVYLVLWLLLPDRSGDLLLERALRRGDVGPVVLLLVTGLVIVGGLVSIGQGGWGGPLWVLLPIALIAWFVIEHGRGNRAQLGQEAPSPASSTPTNPTLPAAPAATPTPPGGTTMSAPTSSFAPPQPRTTPNPYAHPTAPYGAQPPPTPPRPIAPPPPPGPRRRRPSGFVGLMALGVAVALFGTGVALDGPLGFPGTPAVLGFALALTGVSVIALVLGLRGRAGGFSSFLVIALGFLLVTSAGASRVHVADGIGERTWVPVSSSSPVDYNLGAGDATLDLSRLVASETASPQRISVHVGAGDLKVLVPSGLNARVDAHVGIGDIRVDDGIAPTQEQSGSDRSLSTTVGDATTPDVVVTADVGLGQITIQEQ